MVRNFLYRIENLLLITPLFCVVIYQVFLGNSAFDIHLHDTYFVTNSTGVLIITLIVMAAPYLFHLSLRYSGKRNRQICKIHVYATILLFTLVFVFLMLFINENLEISARRYYDFSSWESKPLFSFFSNAIGLFILLFTLLQFWFLVYFLMITLKKVK